MEGLIEALRWAGLSPDEGPTTDTPRGPYVQSRRLELYERHAKRLLDSGKAYRCYCSKERLSTLKDAHGNGKYDGQCRNLPSSHSTAGEPFVVRFRVPTSGTMRISDAVYGTLTSANRLLDDAVIIKSDVYPTYHFSSVVDDHLMGITTVMRGQEWLPSTPLHCLLYEAFGWEPPRFAHLPLLIRKDGAKLSKRQNDSFVEWYRKAGYLPPALLNFVAYLGWTPRVRNEVMSLDEMSAKFAAGDVNRADATVDLDKLDWFNRQHLIRISSDGTDKILEMVADLRRCLDDSAGWSDEYLARCIRLLSVQRLCSPQNLMA